MSIDDYFFKHYFVDHCTLCGNWGVIDTTGTKTPAGVPVGRLNFCICPNGRALREGGADAERVMVEKMRAA
jgi:hypothetical protein